MNARQKEWVAALRSGKYVQASGSLRKDDGYCCLGVACDLSGQGEWQKEPWSSGSTYKAWHFDHESTMLPDAVMDWLGMRDERGSYTKNGETVAHSSLSMANDTGYTFEQIADLIEAHADELFVNEG